MQGSNVKSEAVDWTLDLDFSPNGTKVEEHKF